MARHITFLSTSSGVAGAQRQVHDLALAMLQHDWRVSVVSMLPLEEMYADLPDAGISVHTLGMQQGIPDPRAIWRLRSLLKQLRPDVLHAHMVHAILLARLTRTTVSLPVLVSTMHNQHQGSHWRYLAYRTTDRFSDATTTVSVAALEDAVRLGAVSESRISVMPNGVAVAGIQRDPEVRVRTRSTLGLDDQFVWLAAGRLTDAKDYPNMLAAFGKLPTDGLASRLLIAGSGPLESELAGLISSSGLAERVTLLGLRDDVPDLLQASDGLVMSSAWEGLPMILLEAGAYALPMVATDVGGSHDAILNGVSGIIVPPRDADDLAEGMRQVMNLTGEQRAQMGDAARAHVVATFDIDVVADRWNSLYRDLLEKA